MLKPSGIALAAMLLVMGSAHAVTSLNDGVRLGATSATNSVCNSKQCIMTTASVTTSSPSEYVTSIANTEAASTDIALCIIFGGSNTGGQPLCLASPADGSVTVSIFNAGATALNGTIKFLLWLIKP